MAKRKVASTTSTVERPVIVNEVRPASPSFLEKNQKPILYVVGALLLVILGWWGYKSMVVGPKQQEAVDALWQAELQFKRDSFRAALDNPGGGYDGFVAIADKYGATPSGNLAKYYAGVCYMQLGEFDNAIQYLEDYDPAGEVLPAMKYGLLGDAYSEKQDFSKALDNYEKAANATDNDLVAPIYLKKLGMLHERQGDKSAANKAYQRIKRDFPNQASTDWREIDKYIYRTSEGK
jgi:tetratricopeptide (TPR) repeat protein